MTNVILIHTHDTGRYISPYGYPAQTNNLEKISNIEIQIYNNCNANFYRIADKNYDHAAYLNSFDNTLKHIKKSFAKPHTT